MGNTAMTEDEFSALIDCRLPYDNEAECVRLMELAQTISDNASFLVLDELARAPRGTDISGVTLLKLIDLWQERCPHPLSQPLADCARVLAANGELSVAASLTLLNLVRAYPGQYAALGIAYMSCDDADGKADALYSEIHAAWGKS